jgi:predicted  nucleic acid-binding Zn-ribbon protein
LRDQLKLLEELQRHDARMHELDGVMKELPQKLTAAETAIAELEKLLDRERNELTDTEAFRKSQEDDQRDAEQLLTKAKAKLSQVKNLRESNAVQRELETTRRQIDTRDEEVQKLASALSQQRDKITEHESTLLQEREALLGQRELVAKRIAELEAQVSEAKIAREATAKLLRPDVLRKYGTIRMKRGMAVVAVKDGTCRGCNMNIPPQLYNVLQRGSSLELCPNCNRIIYWAKLLEEASPQS